MENEYGFIFEGTKDAFLDKLSQFHTSNDTHFYLDDYLVDLDGDQIRFGVARGGHSGGYWYIPEITESENRLEFRGKLQYIGPGSNAGPIRKVIDSVGDFLLLLLILPLVLVFKLYVMIDKFIKIIRKCPKPREITTEERLVDLMENYLDCTRKEK